MQFPRSKRLPEEKKLTKWEKFAKEAKIKKRKKTGMVFDEETNRMVAKWGKKSKKNFIPPIMEEKLIGRNPFKDAADSKKLRRREQ